MPQQARQQSAAAREMKRFNASLDDTQKPAPFVSDLGGLQRAAKRRAGERGRRNLSTAALPTARKTGNL